MSLPRPLPFYFGPEHRPLFGQLHRPTGQNAHPMGIVLCNPIGYEAISTHRTLRHFAERAAQLGFPVLRFDYDGTGNSGGLDLDPDRAEAWIESVSHAIDAMKRFANVTTVCLFGLRLGCSLATVAAQGRNDVRALIAFAPVVDVRTYLREIRALAMASPQSPSPDMPGTDPSIQEAAGFPTTAETRSALGKIDLLQLPPPARDILICERDDFPGNDAWSQQLAEQGATVSRIPLAGYAEMMLDAHASVVPLAAITDSLKWLQSLVFDSTTLQPVARPSAAFGGSERANVSIQTSSGPATVTERPALIEPGGLFGVLTEPADEVVTSRRKEVLVLLNSGTIHHIGPHRLYVNLARECAANGIAVLRLDLSGIGETPPQPGNTENVPYGPTSNRDIQGALQFLRKRYPKASLHVAGVCSGAYHGLKVAVQGAPLRSVIVINPLTYFWKEGMSLESADFKVTAEATRYRRTALELSAWLKLLRGEVNVSAAVRVLSKRVLAVANHGLREIGRALRIPLKDDLASELRHIARKRIDMYFVFSASDPGLSMLHEQGGRRIDRLSRRKKLKISVIDGADHTFTARWTRERLTALLLGHLGRYA